MYETSMAEQDKHVKAFSYTKDVIEALKASLSPERMQTYLTETQGDREKAALLYTWNTAISAAFYGPLQGLEVALRNAMHSQLERRYGSAWYDNSETGLDDGCRGRIANAKLKLTRDGYRADPPQIVSALSFGFWVSLLGHGGRIEGSEHRANYEMKLWRPSLRGAFPHCENLTRRQAHKPLNYLRTLRNRIAHHEPIFARHLAEDYARILEVTGWISPGTREWINHHSRVRALLEIPRDGTEVGF